MTQPTERCEDLMQREVDTEIRLINEFLTDIDSQKQHMSYFVAGLHVAIESILAAVEAVKDKHPQESKQTSTQEPCPEVEEGEISEAEEDQMDKTQTEEEDPEESNISSDLRKSLNNTLGDLEQVEDKLIKMDCRDHMATAASQQPSGDSACYLDFMYEFLAKFRQKLSGSCEEFLCMESQEMALLQEKKALKDLSFQLANSPRKTATPKDCSTATTATETTAQGTNKDNNTPSATESTQKDNSKDNTPSATESTKKDNSKDTTPSATEYTEKDNSKDNISSVAESTQIYTSKDNTSPATESTQIYTSKNNTSSATESTQIYTSKDNTSSERTSAQEDGDSQDNTSSEIRSTVTEKSKAGDTPSTETNATPQKDDPKKSIFSEPMEGPQQGDDKGASSNIKITPPQDASTTSTSEVTPEDQKYSIDQIVDDDDEFDYVSPVGMKRMFGTMSQESKIQFPPTSPINIGMDSPTKAKISFEVSPAGGENES